jgi:hypothetical protein
MSERPITAIVEYQVGEEGATLDEWLQDWAKRADDARIGEPETLAYEAAVSLEDESKVLVFARYQHGPSSLKTHMEQTAHVVMNASFTDLRDYGWWRRANREHSEDGKTSGETLLVIAVWRVAEPAMKEPFLELARSHARFCWENEPDTLTYGGGIATQDFDRVDIVRGDLVFVIECSDMEALDKHVNCPEHVEMGEKMVAAGIQVAPSYRQLYRTTGLGFMSRISPLG